MPIADLSVGLNVWNPSAAYNCGRNRKPVAFVKEPAQVHSGPSIPIQVTAAKGTIFFGQVSNCCIMVFCHTVN